MAISSLLCHVAILGISSDIYRKPGGRSQGTPSDTQRPMGRSRFDLNASHDRSRRDMFEKNLESRWYGAVCECESGAPPLPGHLIFLA